MNEAEIHSKLKHINIVELKDFSDTCEEKRASGKSREVFYLALELAKGGELFDFIAQTGAFSEPVARYYFHQIIDSLDYMHSQGISHRDLKPENILMGENFNLKLADFGFSSRAEVNSTRKGTCAYMAPEIHLGEEYSGASVDLFAAGIILYIMLVGRPCFHQATAADPYYKYMAAGKCDHFWKKHIKTFENGRESYSEEWYDFINRLLQYQPEDRLNMEQLKEHPWFTAEMPSEEEVREEFQKRTDMLNGFAGAGEGTPDEVGDDVYGTRVHRGEDDIDEKDTLQTLERTCKEWVSSSKVTKFFSTSGEDKLFNGIAAFANANEALDYSFSRDKFRAYLTMIEEVGEDEDMIEQQVKFTVDILKVKDEDKWVVEFSKTEGDIFVFNTIFKDARDYFGTLCNATQ